MKKTVLSVCFLTESFTPALVNGAANQIRLLSERLAQRGVKVLIIANRTTFNNPAKEEMNGIEIIRVLPAIGPSRYNKYLMLLPALIRLLIRRRDFDLLIVCNLRVLGLLGVPIAHLLRKKVLLRAESCGELDGRFATQFEKRSSALKSRFANVLTRLRNRIILNVNGYLSISSAISEELRAVGVHPQKISQITNGIDLSRFKPVDDDSKRKLRYALGFESKKVFIFTGRLAKGKGLRYLLRVWRRVCAIHDDLMLVLIGSGEGWSQSCEAELKNFVDHYQMNDSVCFTGRVENVHDYLNAGDFFIFPSQSEGLGISLIEAMACTLPSIATGVGGILDIIDHRDNGFLVQYGDEETLFTLIVHMLENAQHVKQLGIKGRQKVIVNFDIEKIVDQYLHLFSSLTVK